MDIDGELMNVLAPVTNKYQILLQPWMDGYLLHCYKQPGKNFIGFASFDNTPIHVTTVGGLTILDCVEKAINYSKK